jgi:hypothetical protein
MAIDHNLQRAVFPMCGKGGYWYMVYIPQNSGMRDSLGVWGWVRLYLNADSAADLQREGFSVLPARG